MKVCFCVSLVWLLATVTMAAPTRAGWLLPDDKAVFSTSFEYEEDAALRALQDGATRIQVTGTAAITSKFSRTGDRCLHLLGDSDNSIIFEIPAEQPNVRGMSFYAERWSSRGPFTFVVEARRDGEWSEVANIEGIVEVGARFRSHIQLAIPGDGRVEAIRFRVTAAPRTGVLIDDLSLLATLPKRPSRIPSDVMPSQPLKLVERQALFVSGENDTHTYRIPAIATATNGDLVAACDARRESSADVIHQRTIDIVYRRSTDNGKTWSPIQVLNPPKDGGCSDPSFIVDRVTGDIFCFYNYMLADKANKEYFFVLQKSSDHGKTWGEPVDITDQIAGPELKEAFKFITSGRGIQTRSGQLVHNFVEVGKGVTLFSSSDHGISWQVLGRVSPGDESKVIELPDGTTMVNSRIGPGRRMIHRSADGGKTWESEADFSLPDPRCNASIVQYTAIRDGYKRDRLIFCNAASNSRRENLAVRISYDNGRTWSDGRVVDPGPAAYSEITVLSDGSLGVLYERGNQQIRFARFTLSGLTGGADQLIKPYSFAAATTSSLSR